MNDFMTRQADVLRQLISDHRSGRMDLNRFIQRVEGVRDVLNVEAWKDALFSIVLSMEQVNAVALDENRGLTEAERTLVEESLLELEALVSRIETA